MKATPFTAPDPEFSGPPGKAPDGLRSAWLVRALLAAQLPAALLTAGWDFGYVAWYHGWLDRDRFRDLDLEALALLAAPTLFAFPPAVWAVSRRGTGRPDRRAVVASFALSGFQLFALLPSVQ